eukprot:s80_g23.t1
MLPSLPANGFSEQLGFRRLGSAKLDCDQQLRRALLRTKPGTLVPTAAPSTQLAFAQQIFRSNGLTSSGSDGLFHLCRGKPRSPCSFRHHLPGLDDIELDRIYRQQRASLERRRNRERLASATQPGFWSTLFTSCAIVTLVFCMMLTAAVALFYWRPDLREHRLVRGIIRRLNRLEDRFINWLAERGLWFTNTARRPRPRVSFAEIQKLQKETFDPRRNEGSSLYSAKCMHSGFTGEEVREATVVPAIPSKYTEVPSQSTGSVPGFSPLSPRRILQVASPQRAGTNRSGVF